MSLFDSHVRKTYRDDNGYLRFIDSDSLVHRWIASKKIGRKLSREEVVHHINKNKMDNDASNLFVCSDQREHEIIHGISNAGSNQRNSYSNQREHKMIYYANNTTPRAIDSYDVAEFLDFVLKLSIIIIEFLLWLLWEITKLICKYLFKLTKYFYYHFIYDYIHTQSGKILENNP